MRSVLGQRLLSTSGAWWRERLYRLISKPRTGSVNAQAHSKVRPVNGFVIFLKQPNPSYTYYLSERFTALPGMSVIIRYIDDDSLDDIDPYGKFVIVCRYIKSRQLDWLEQNAAKLSGIGLFIDDDVAALISGKEASIAYKRRLFQLAVWPLKRLNPLLDIIWVSTPPLREVLLEEGSMVYELPPLPRECRDVPPLVNKEGKPLTIGYHATAVHWHEHLFLAPIVSRIMTLHPNVYFEVTADGPNALIWRKMDNGRIKIRPLLPWNEYLESNLNSDVAIALVPLLSSKVNICRADTKRIDVSRMSAAAVFSKSAVFDRHQQSGEIHVQNSVDDWISAIDELIRSPERRREAALATKLSVASMIKGADLHLPGLSIRSVEM